MVIPGVNARRKYGPCCTTGLWGGAMSALHGRYRERAGRACVYHSYEARLLLCKADDAATQSRVDTADAADTLCRKPGPGGLG
jgi:hypothetical protein